MTQRNKIIIVSVIAGLVFVVLPLIFFLSSLSNSHTTPGVEGKKNTVVIDNASSYTQELSEDSFNRIGDAVYTRVGWSVDKPESLYHGVVRNGSFASSNATVVFIVDIDSIKLSFQVLQTVNQSLEAQGDTSVTCVDESDMIYPSATCVDSISAQVDKSVSESQKKVLSFAKNLPLTSITYRITYGNSPTNKSTYALFVDMYESTGKQDALSAIQSFGYNPADFEIIYTDKTSN